MTDDAPPKQKPGTFVKGDPRCWRYGRPKSFDSLRALAQAIAAETAKSGGNTIVIDGHSVTVAEAIMREWAMSKDPRKQAAFIRYAYGEPPQQHEISGPGAGALIINMTWDNADDNG